MKKIKKFATGGRFVDEGESQRYVEDAPADVPVAAPVAVGIEPRQLGPMSGGVGAGIGGLQDAAGRAETLMPFTGTLNNEPGRLPTLNNGPMPISRSIGAGLGGGQDVSRPIGQLMPPPNRRIGVRGAVPGTYASGMGGMKKGGAVKKMAKGGSVSSASKRADGCAVKGKTKGRII